MLIIFHSWLEGKVLCLSAKFDTLEHMVAEIFVIVYVHPFYGVRKKWQTMLLNFLIHFLLSDAQPDFTGHFHQDFSHIAQAQWN